MKELKSRRGAGKPRLLNSEQIKRMSQLRKEGFTYHQLAKMFGLANHSSARTYLKRSELQERYHSKYSTVPLSER